MGRIFSEAIRVLVWLGPVTSDSTSCVEAMRILGTLVAEATHPDVSKEDVKIDVPQPWNWHHIDAFYSRPWFWRLWCVQELVLSKSSTLLWGDAAIDWECAANVTSYLIGVGSMITRELRIAGVHNASVSYTHLTLPTKRIV